jgi:hypothetical protein
MNLFKWQDATPGDYQSLYIDGGPMAMLVTMYRQEKVLCVNMSGDAIRELTRVLALRFPEALCHPGCTKNTPHTQWDCSTAPPLETDDAGK